MSGSARRGAGPTSGWRRARRRACRWHRAARSRHGPAARGASRRRAAQSAHRPARPTGTWAARATRAGAGGRRLDSASGALRRRGSDRSRARPRPPARPIAATGPPTSAGGRRLRALPARAPRPGGRARHRTQPAPANRARSFRACDRPAGARSAGDRGMHRSSLPASPPPGRPRRADRGASPRLWPSARRAQSTLGAGGRSSGAASAQRGRTCDDRGRSCDTIRGRPARSPSSMSSRSKWQALPTEAINPATLAIDKLSTLEIVESMLNEDRKMLAAVQREKARIAVGVDIITAALRRHGRVIFVGAGTSGRLGVLESAEMPITFGTDPEMVQAIMAGGKNALMHPLEGIEDNYEEGARAVTRLKPTKKDVVVGVSASGMTPFVRGALTRARRAGSKIIFVTCDPGTELQTFVDVTIAPAVGPEVIAG